MLVLCVAGITLKIKRTKEYLALNPTGFVPTLIHNVNVICESMAICEYLDEEFPGPKLLPGDSTNRALIRSLCMNVRNTFFKNNTWTFRLSPEFNHFKFQRSMKKFPRTATSN
jgi:glutathione S-transferase